jgi:hypothetical protein
MAVAHKNLQVVIHVINNFLQIFGHHLSGSLGGWVGGWVGPAKLFRQGLRTVLSEVLRH